MRLFTLLAFLRAASVARFRVVARARFVRASSASAAHALVVGVRSLVDRAQKHRQSSGG